MDLDPALADVFDGGLSQAAGALARFGVDYALIGGAAVSLLTQPRFTKDIDFLLNVPQIVLPGLLDEFHARGFDFDLTKTIREWNQHNFVSLSFAGIPIDWLKPVIPAYQHVLDRATELALDTGPVRVATPEGLILLKLLAYRLQDQIDIENLVAAAEGSLDIEWIRAEWQTIANLDDPRMRKLEEMIA